MTIVPPVAAQALGAHHHYQHASHLFDQKYGVDLLCNDKTQAGQAEQAVVPSELLLVPQRRLQLQSILVCWDRRGW